MGLRHINTKLNATNCNLSTMHLDCKVILTHSSDYQLVAWKSIEMEREQEKVKVTSLDHLRNLTPEARQTIKSITIQIPLSQEVIEEMISLQLPTSLTTLNLSYNDIGAEGMKSPVSWLPTSLTTLNLRNNRIGAEGMKSLVSWLPTSLTTLNLRGNNIESTLTFDGLLDESDLTVILNERCPKLKVLDLSNNRLTHIHLGIFDLKVLPNLVEVRLEDNDELCSPPLDVVDIHSLASLREYALSKKEKQVQLKVAVIGHEQDGKTVLTFSLMDNYESAAEIYKLNRDGTSNVKEAKEKGTK